jgi:integrase
MAAALLEVKNSKYLEENTDKTLGEYLDYWLEKYAKTKTKPKTYAEYEKIINNHIKPSLGDIMLKKLTSIQIQDYYSNKLNVLSAQSVLHHHRILTKSLNNAIKWKFIKENVAKDAEPPRPEPKEMKTLSVEELNILLETAKKITPVYYPIIYAASHTGMRKSELIGLKWSNVDLNLEKIYVRETITEANGKYFFNPRPKNGKSRGVKLTTELTKLLQNLKNLNDERKKILGETYNPLDLVFCNSVGNISASSEITRGLKRALKDANLPDIRFHDLRHTHATILLKAGVHPKIVSERLGHTKIGITLDLYSEVTNTIEQQAVSALDEMLI